MYVYSDYGSSTANAGMGVVGIISAIISIAVCVFMIVCMWKLNVKAGRPGWAALIPFYNTWVEFDIIYGQDGRCSYCLYHS